MKTEVVKAFEFILNTPESPCCDNRLIINQHHAVECVLIDSVGDEQQIVLSPQYFLPAEIMVAHGRYKQAVEQAETNVESMRGFGIQMKYIIRLYYWNHKREIVVKETTVE